jgi:hypothetical protein
MKEKKYYKYAPEVEYPNLFFETSQGIIYNLRENNIEHTKSEITLLRKNILDDLNKEGINQKTYNQKDHFFLRLGTTLDHIDRFYYTKLAEEFRRTNYGF